MTAASSEKEEESVPGNEVGGLGDFLLCCCWPFPSNIHQDENLGLGTAACGNCLTQSEEIV